MLKNYYGLVASVSSVKNKFKFKIIIMYIIYIYTLFFKFLILTLAIDLKITNCFFNRRSI